MRRGVSRIVAAGIIVVLVYVSWRQAVLTGRSARDRFVGARVAPVGASGFSVRYPSLAFVATCRPSHVAADDPIVHPGVTGASHEHQFFGNRMTTAQSVLAELRRSATTCDDRADHAAYWLPSARSSRWSALRAYYSAGHVDAALIEPYPLGIQMIGGRSARSVAWSCGRGVDEIGWTSDPPACKGSVPLVVRVSFPQCWDGLGLSPDHVAGTVRGACPASHRHALPLLRLRAELSGLSGSPADVVLSSGSAATMHADFWNAWEPARLAELVAVCIRGERASNGQLEICRAAGSGRSQ